MVNAYSAPKEDFCVPPLGVMHEWLVHEYGPTELGKVSGVPADLLVELYPEVREYAFFTLMRGTPAIAKFQLFLEVVCEASSQKDTSFMETLKEFEHWGNSYWRSSVELFWRDGSDPLTAELAMEVKWAAEMCSPDNWWMLVDGAVVIVGLFLASSYVDNEEIHAGFADVAKQVNTLFIDLGLNELVDDSDAYAGDGQ